jgi:hypothetical protein
MYEAAVFLGALAQGDRRITLNLVGLSRGGVLTMRFANRIYRDQKYADIRKQIERINIIAFEPASGDRFVLTPWTRDNRAAIPPGEFVLNPLVSRYVGMYAADERAALFSAAIPAIESPATKVWMFTVPGAHETLVGNLQTDGHHSNANWRPCYVMPFWHECADDRDDGLKTVSFVATFIATRLLGSPHWGNVQFDMDKLNEWRPGLGSDATFRKKVGKMWDWSMTQFGVPFMAPPSLSSATYDYRTMRQFSLDEIGISGYEYCQERAGLPIQYNSSRAIDWPGLEGWKYDRCIDWFKFDAESGEASWAFSTFHELQANGVIEPLVDGRSALARLRDLGYPAAGR